MRAFIARHPLGLALAMALASVVLLSMTALQEADIFWSIREGNRLLATGNFLPVETWNFQAAGKTWLPNSWLWNVILATAWNLGHVYGLVLLNAGCLVLTLGLIYFLGRELGAKRYTRYLVLLVGALLLYGFFSDRANQADIILLLGYALFVAHLRHIWSRRIFWPALVTGTVLFAALSMNLHLTGAVYLALFPAFTLAIFATGIATWRGRVTIAVVTGLATAIGLLLTPYGLTGLLKALIVADNSRDLIIEWNPPRWDTYVGISTWLTIAAGVALIILLVRQRRFFSIVPLALFVIASTQATRFSLYLAVLIVVFALLHLRVKRTRDVEDARSFTGFALLGSGLMLFIALIPTFTTLTDPARIVETDASEFTHIPSHARVLSSPSSGSRVLFYRPDVQVALDGRNDLIGRHDYIEAINTYYGAPIPVLRAYLNREHIDAIYLARSNEKPTAARMDQLGWHRYDARWGWTYVRPRADTQK